ncbi:MAG: ChbG/HpnK family deacetylase [Solobacterium sp.]|nr:ChbG/HpnK family deacetylase [Solobacterium sp.]
MRKRLIYRCDDVGYSEAYDLGVFRVLESGIGCSADVMLDSAHVEEALKKLKNMPWISVGWHRHLWERPVLPASEVPTLVDEEGRFKWRHRHPERMAEASYEDAYREFKAEAKLCFDILGRYPDVASFRGKDIPLERAFQDVLDECGIVYGFYSSTGSPRFPAEKCTDERYASLHIISDMSSISQSYKMEDWASYDPLKGLLDPVWTEDEEIFFYGWHPGYLDDHILAESSCSVHRVRELQCALSDTYRNWIIDNGIELINFRDALYGTNEFQDHLRDIGSDLWIGRK